MTTQTEHAPFPTDETLAAYVDGRLDDATRRRVVEHIADCAECFEVVQVNQEMTTTAAPVGQVIRWPRNASIGLAAAAVIGAVVLLTPVREVVWPPDDLRALAKVAPPKRHFEGRLTGFPYQRFDRTRGAEDSAQGDRENDVDLESLAFYSVAADVQKRAMNHPTARTWHAEGVSFLELRDKKNAVATLEKARDSSSKPDPQLLSDLAAAYIETGDYKAALDSANGAWAIAKTPEIAWNRALAAERAQDYKAAVAFWQDYLQFKNESPQWIAEAGRHLENSKEALQTPSK